MTRITLSLILALFICINSGNAQSDSLHWPLWELSGSFFYSSSTQASLPMFMGNTSRTRTWAIEPGITWFADQYSGIGLDFRYEQFRRETEYDTDAESGAIWSDYSGTLQVAIGLDNNLPLLRSVWVYANLKVGVTWEHAGGNNAYGSPYSFWSSPKIVFPIFQGGLKYFLFSRCATVLQLQYNRMTSDSHSDFSVGIGLAVYL